jgi:L-threonylcarbamoyladenylate synthase
MAEVIAESDPRALDFAVQLLRAGELVAYPTDTVYGLGAAASEENAVRRLYAVKGRPLSKAVPLLVADSLMAEWVGEMTSTAHTLASKFWPGALTIVVRKKAGFFSLALAGQDTVALRVPDHDVPRGISKMLGEPLTGTSANRSGARPPVSAAEVAFQLGEMVPLVIDGGRSRGGRESTVIDVTAEGGPKIVRQGPVSLEELEQALGRKLGGGG